MQSSPARISARRHCKAAWPAALPSKPALSSGRPNRSWRQRRGVPAHGARATVPARGWRLHPVLLPALAQAWPVARALPAMQVPRWSGKALAWFSRLPGVAPLHPQCLPRPTWQRQAHPGWRQASGAAPAARPPGRRAWPLRAAGHRTHRRRQRSQGARWMAFWQAGYPARPMPPRAWIAFSTDRFLRESEDRSRSPPA